MKKTLLLCFTVLLLTTMTSLISCKENAENTQNQSEPVEATIKVADVPEYFLLRPEVEKAYGY